MPKKKPGKNTEEVMAVDQKVLDEKIKTGKALNKEETEVVLKEEGAVEGYSKAPVVTEEVKPEETPVEEKKPETAVEKAPEPKPETKPDSEPGDPFLKIERELAKPEGQEDLKTFTDREKAYFHQMRRDRKGRQKAEEERDAALFRETQRKREEPAKEAPKEEDPLAELDKKDPTDFLTVADVRKILSKQQKKEEPKIETTPKTGIDPLRLRYLKMCDEEARATHPEDYDAVVELTGEIVSHNKDYVQKISESVEKGENPALVTYELIKKDPEFEKLFPVAKTRVEARKAVTQKAEAPAKSPEDIKKEDEARQAQETLEKNQSKPKTTGHVGGGEDKAAGELSMEEISKMSDRQFAKLPRATRQRYLEMYG